MTPIHNQENGGKDYNISLSKSHQEHGDYNHMNYLKTNMRFGDSVPNIVKHKFDITKTYDQEVGNLTKDGKVSIFNLKIK